MYPLWLDAEATISNVKPALLNELSEKFGKRLGPEDVFAYCAGVMAHSAFTERFARDLRRPGLRLPITSDVALFDEASELGRRSLWLFSYGERFTEPSTRPAGAPRMATNRPTIPDGGDMPGASEPLPNEIRYAAADNRLHIGRGFIDNVTPAMRNCDVSGMNVLDQWFSYRRLDRTRPVIGNDKRPPSPLMDIQPGHWLPEYTDDLIDLLNVLGLLTELEPEQADMLESIMKGPLFDLADLAAEGAFAMPGE